MKAATSELQTLLYSGNAWTCVDLYEVVLSGSTTYWADRTTSLVTGGHTYVAGPPLQRGSIRTPQGIEISTYDLTIYPAGFTLAGQDIIPFAITGGFESARVTCRRAYLASDGSVVGTVIEWSGPVIEVKPDCVSVALTIKSDLALTQLGSPHIIGPYCPYALGDAQCGVSMAAHTETKTCAAGCTTSTVKATSSWTKSKAASWIVVDTGAQAGQRRTVRSSGGDTLTLTSSLPAALAAGDQVTLYRGCNKTVAECRNTYSNLARNGAYPLIPQEEATK